MSPSNAASKKSMSGPVVPYGRLRFRQRMVLILNSKGASMAAGGDDGRGSYRSLGFPPRLRLRGPRRGVRDGCVWVYGELVSGEEVWT
jgi:hypothetical protein